MTSPDGTSPAHTSTAATNPAPETLQDEPLQNTAPATTWPEILGAILSGIELSAEQVRWAMSEIMAGNATDSQLAAFAYGIQVKGLTAGELNAAAEAMLSFSRRVDFSDLPKRVDIVGTGGDGHHTVNISTMSSFVIAATGVPVVKHGNRAASSRSGGADMLEALGINIEQEPEEIHADAMRTNFAFMFAKTYHPAMRHARQVRSELKVPTIFNLLGPMTNPAAPSFGLIGCAFPEMQNIMAEAFARNGDRVLVVRGQEGMDEISVSSPTDIVAADGTCDRPLEHLTITPEELGLDRYPLSELVGGDPAFNAEIARQLFRGEISGAIKDAVIINSAGALTAVHGWEDGRLVDTLREQVAVARESLESGAARAALERVLGKAI